MANELESLRKFQYHDKMDLRRESRRSYSSMNRFTLMTFFDKSNILAFYERNIENLEVTCARCY